MNIEAQARILALRIVLAVAELWEVTVVTLIMSVRVYK